MTDAYLRENPPRRSQFRSPRRQTPSGVTVVHTAESIMDSVDEDTGAENVARFIRNRSDAGSYHDIVDSDSGVYLVRYGDEAYQDGTGSNPHALSISFACKTSDWAKMSKAKRAGFLREGARAFARQQKWLKDNGFPRTPLQRINREQSAAGVPGFISHADRDPGRRSDPGKDFPWDEFLYACLLEVTVGQPNPSPTPNPFTGGPAMIIVLHPDGRRQFLCDKDTARHIGMPERNVAVAGGTPYVGADKASDADRGEFLLNRGVTD